MILNKELLLFFCLVTFYVIVSSDILARVSLYCCVASAWSLMWVKLLALTWAQLSLESTFLPQRLCPSSLSFPPSYWVIELSSLGKKVFAKASSFSLVWCIKLSVYYVQGPLLDCGKIWINFRQFYLWTVVVYWKWTCESYAFLQPCQLFSYSWYEMIHYHPRLEWNRETNLYVKRGRIYCWNMVQKCWKGTEEWKGAGGFT